MSQAGAFQQIDYFDLTGGLNNTDSPFRLAPQFAAGGRNWEYIRTGAVKKRLGPSKLNNSANASVRCSGLHVRNTTDDTISLIRAADRKLQLTTLAGSFTNLSEDTVTAGTNFLAADNTAQVTSAMFTTPTTNILWLAGGGMGTIKGVYSTSKVTINGVPVLTGSVSTSIDAVSGGGVFAATGTYRYTFALRKTSTQALSNVALDTSATISATTDEVDLNLSTITAVDTTKYDKVYIYRSAVNGAASFTTGTLIAQVNTGTSSYTDLGTTGDTVNIPRSGNTVLDNTQLDSGKTYKYLTVFKRRLITASGSTLYISDLNKAESWPLHNVFDIPSGGQITGLAVISFVTPTTSSLDELLVIFKENELWVVDGTGALDDSGVPDWSLKSIDKIGCTSHNSIVTANGFLFWMNGQGFYMWDGSGKPILISRPIQELFESEVMIDRSKLGFVVGQYYRKQNQIIWFLSHSAYGEQQYALKLDLRLTIPAASQNLSNRIVDGVFIPDSFPLAIYAACAYKPADEDDETLILADGSGFIYRHLDSNNDVTDGVEFEYETPFLNQNLQSQQKTYHKVIAYVEQQARYDLTLDYWSDYRVGEGAKSTVVAKAAALSDGTSALFDVAQFDMPEFDVLNSRPLPIVFNLEPAKGNTQGDAIKLRFRQYDVDKPVIIYGFSILYSIIGNTR